MNIEEVFDNYHDEFYKFDRVINKKSLRADLHALILLDSIFPEKMNIIAAAEHDQIWFSCDLDELSEKITESQIIELVRCGVFVDQNGLSKFV